MHKKFVVEVHYKYMTNNAPRQHIFVGTCPAQLLIIIIQGLGVYTFPKSTALLEIEAIICGKSVKI